MDMDGNNWFKMIPKIDEEWDNSGEWSPYVPTIQLVYGDNSETITKYSGYDPQVGSGVDYGNYPQSRTFTFGLNATF